ncbi:MAG: DNA-binding response regulator [Chitinophagia bacterium]|jgi:two-component system, OmpR family, alkaline phosphatase synthesis response regulator PhoP|nr:DNA-binding response regulator [Chitinophagia bacterium]
MAMDVKKILIADDEPDILEIISYNLELSGYKVVTAADGEKAIEIAKLEHPDLIILDIMMPKKNGIEVCKYLRSQTEFQDTIIVFLTALNDELSHVKGLEFGADDFITKPISPKVMVSKVNSFFRRINKNNSSQAIEIGDLRIEPEEYLVYFKNEPISLAKKEFELLAYLASKPGRVFLRNEILNKIWGNDVIVGDRTIDVHIRKIRQKLGIDCITTVKGVGYKFEL